MPAKKCKPVFEDFRKFLLFPGSATRKKPQTVPVQPENGPRTCNVIYDLPGGQNAIKNQSSPYLPQSESMKSLRPQNAYRSALSVVWGFSGTFL